MGGGAKNLSCNQEYSDLPYCFWTLSDWLLRAKRLIADKFLFAMTRLARQNLFELTRFPGIPVPLRYNTDPPGRWALNWGLDTGRPIERPVSGGRPVCHALQAMGIEQYRPSSVRYSTKLVGAGRWALKLISGTLQGGTWIPCSLRSPKFVCCVTLCSPKIVCWDSLRPPKTFCWGRLARQTFCWAAHFARQTFFCNEILTSHQWIQNGIPPHPVLVKNGMPPHPVFFQENYTKVTTKCYFFLLKLIF